ncbi:MAG: PIG-L family deacetylase [Candidatus Omnitrophota bacterium]
MAKRIISIFFWLVFSIGYNYALAQQGVAPLDIGPIKKSDRVLILAPHPDDETIGCAGVIQSAVKAGAAVRIVYLTNGDYNQASIIVYKKTIPLMSREFIHMGEVRRKEAVKAMGLLGVGEKNLIFLGYPDFGTFAIFSRHWGESKPYKSMLTRISAVPYKKNLSYNAPYKGESVLSDLKGILLAYRPNKIFVSHPADTNVDHKALYLFLQVALRDLASENMRVRVYPYLIHCLDWPLPRHYHPELTLNLPRQFGDSSIKWRKLDLTSEQLDKKYQAILCYRSQTRISAFYLLSFARKNELFGDYPEIRLRNQIPQKGMALLFSGFSRIFRDPQQGYQPLVLDKTVLDEGMVSYSLSEGVLFIRVDKPKHLNRRFSVIFYLFGYSKNTPFSLMPKLRIVARPHRIRVFDADRLIQPQGIDLSSKASELILKIPLGLLGNPDFILTSVRASNKGASMDSIGFRRINII